MMVDMVKYYEQLVGGKIYGFDFHEEDGEKWPVFWIDHPDYGSLKVEVSRDSEGNGSGFLFISEDNTPVLPMSVRKDDEHVV